MAMWLQSPEGITAFLEHGTAAYDFDYVLREKPDERLLPQWVHHGPDEWMQSEIESFHLESNQVIHFQQRL